MRRIQLRRGDRPITEIDLYDVLRRGDKSHDVQLLPGDVVYIPPVGPQVAIVGNVKEPGIYELKGDTTNISAALEEAGGLTTMATTQRVILEQIENHQWRHVDEFALNAPSQQRVLRDGDLLQFFPISQEFENSVMLRGNVKFPGRFPWHEGMRVSDVIPTREALITGEHWDLENHLADVRHTDIMADIAQTNAEIDWGYAVIERLDEQDLSTRLIPFNLGKAVDNPASSDNQLLKVGDVITVFSRRDVALPQDQHSTFVQLGGEVNAPGVYRVKPGETLREMVERAGGLTSKSYLFASQLTRISTRLVEETQLKLSLGQLQRQLMPSYANGQSPGSSQAANINPVNQQAQLAMQQDLINQLSLEQPTGRVILGIRPEAKSSADIPDMPLEDGDIYYIPPRLSTIQVVGEVYNQNAFRYQVKKRLGGYLNDSGGGTRQADLKRIFLIRADGTVISRQAHNSYWSGNFENMVLMPGDTIIVPPKLKTPGGLLDVLPAITQIISQTAVTGAVLSLIHP